MAEKYILRATWHIEQDGKNMGPIAIGFSRAACEIVTKFGVASFAEAIARALKQSDTELLRFCAEALQEESNEQPNNTNSSGQGESGA